MDVQAATSQQNILLPTMTLNDISEVKKEFFGIWKFSKDKRKNMVLTMVFKRTEEFPDYLIIPSCSSADSDIEEEFNHTYINFLSPSKLVRVQLGQKDQKECLTKFESLNYKYNPNTMELSAFHDETPNDKDLIFVEAFKGKLIIKRNKFNGYYTDYDFEENTNNFFFNYKANPMWSMTSHLKKDKLYSSLNI
jgi:hypothetical protein